MEEVKNRGWVKNAAIIFLAAMLFLTFFSNTILNRSLPEVATVAVKSDSITAKVRGTGKVKSSEVYTVKSEQTTKLQSVKVKEGDKVSVGDVLFVLSVGDSKELKQLRDEYCSLENAYKQQLVGNGGTDHSAEIARVNKLLADRDEAKRRLDNYFNGADYTVAVRQIQDRIDQLTREKDAIINAILNGDAAAYQTAVAALQQAKMDHAAAQAEYDTLNNYLNTRNSLQTAYNDAQINLSSAEAAYNSKMQIDPNNPEPEKSAMDDKRRTVESTLQALNNWDAQNPTLAGKSSNEYSMRLQAMREKCDEKQNAVNQILSNQSTRINDATIDINKRIANETAMLESAQGYITRYNNAQNDFLNANASVLTSMSAEGANAERSKLALEEAKRKMDQKAKELEDMEYGFTPEQRQKIDEKQAEIDSLAEEIKKEPSDEKNAKLAELQAELEKIKGVNKNTKEIRATINGYITSVPVTAGSDITKGDILATIANSDSGHTVEFSITTDQAQRIRVGDEGSISNFYWGNSISAKVQKINPDPKDARNKKVIVFEIEGTVSEGEELTISVGSKSATYDMVVPKSAIRSDSNGNFVLVLTSKNNALGNRYFAKRVAVEEVASDDVNAAVTGALNNGDYVITTSSKPIKDKDQCKLAN